MANTKLRFDFTIVMPEQLAPRIEAFKNLKDWLVYEKCLKFLTAK